MKIEKGKYTILGLLNISHSLMYLEKEKNKKGIYKVLLKNEDMYVGYFIEEVDFGKGSLIFIKRDLDLPLVKKEHYEIIEKRGEISDDLLINNMIKKLKEKAGK